MFEQLDKEKQHKFRGVFRTKSNIYGGAILAKC